MTGGTYKILVRRHLVNNDMAKLEMFRMSATRRISKAPRIGNLMKSTIFLTIEVASSTVVRKSAKFLWTLPKEPLVELITAQPMGMTDVSNRPSTIQTT